MSPEGHVGLAEQQPLLDALCQHIRARLAHHHQLTHAPVNDDVVAHLQQKQQKQQQKRYDSANGGHAGTGECSYGSTYAAEGRHKHRLPLA